MGVLPRKIFQGFSLMELMVVLILISILSLISFPLYNDQVIRVRRTYMMGTLLDVTGRLEEYRALHHTYDGANLEQLLGDRSRHDKYYHVNLVAKDNSFILSGTPIGKQAQDILCGTLMLDQDGNKSASGNDGSTRCWL